MSWGDIVCSGVLGGVRVDRADETSAISLELLTGSCSHVMSVAGDRITIADQVVYQVTGYSYEDKALLVRLVEDRRPSTPEDASAAVGT